MLFSNIAINKNIIDVRCTKIIQMFFQNIINKMLLTDKNVT